MNIKQTYNLARRSFAEWLRKWADRIGPEDAFAATGIHFYYRYGIGKVIEEDDGISLTRRNDSRPGVYLWYRRSDYDERRFGDPDTARILTRFHDMIREANEPPKPGEPW